MTEDDRPAVGRRTVLGALTGVGSAALAGCSALDPADDDSTSELDAAQARELAERFAPTLYFDEYEKWFPTDPRPYTSEPDGEPVVHGFDAVEGYHGADDEDEPPEPAAFYHAVQYDDSSLVAIQYWFYYVFDQFSCNFHWHDWEVLHVFVDVDTGEPQLYVGSSHSRDVPNNEFLDPDPAVVPRILPELGSHSSTLSVNEVPDRFQRIGDDDLLADVTNETIDRLADLVDVPFAYGLPRDEGVRLPMVIPELDGVPLYEHDAVPSFTRESLIAEELTVRSLTELESPPTDLPLREPGLVFEHLERDGGADVGYALHPTSEIDHITGFTGPQLSFEFPVPDVVEDAVSHHISTTGTPWDQPRYDNPAADISASSHREALSDRYDAIGAPASVDTVIARISETTTSDDAPEDEGLTTTNAPLEGVALLESDPEMRPTFGGVATFGDVEPGAHHLTVNAAGTAPHRERLTVGDGEADTDADEDDDAEDDDAEDDDDAEGGRYRRAGVDGQVPLVARDKATRLELDDGDVDTDIVRSAIEDDFAGRIYDSAVDGTDTVYVHEGGAYTTELRDGDAEIGAVRVNPDPGSGESIRIDRPETGKASLAAFLADISEETRASVAAVESTDDETDGGNGARGTDDGGGSENAVQGLERALEAVVEAATRAEQRAREGDQDGTDRQLAAVRDRLERVTERLEAASDDLPSDLSNAAANRAEQADRRAEQAQNAGKL